MCCKRVVTCLAIMLTMAGGLCHAQLTGPWPIYAHDNAHSGHTTTSIAPSSQPVEIWRTAVGASSSPGIAAESSPVLAPDGSMIYAVMGNVIVALNTADGTKCCWDPPHPCYFQWENGECDDQVTTGPIVVEGGHLYALWSMHDMSYQHGVKLVKFDPETGNGQLVVPTNPPDGVPTFGVGQSWLRTIVAANERIYAALCEPDEKCEWGTVVLRAYWPSQQKLDPVGVELGEAYIQHQEEHAVWGLAADDDGDVFVSGARDTQSESILYVYCVSPPPDNSVVHIHEHTESVYWDIGQPPVVNPQGTKVYQVASLSLGNPPRTYVKHMQRFDDQWHDCNGLAWDYITGVSLARTTQDENEYIYVGHLDESGQNAHVEKYLVIDEGTDRGIKSDPEWQIILPVAFDPPYITIDKSGAILVCCGDDALCYEDGEQSPQLKWSHALGDGQPVANSIAVIHAERVYGRTFHRTTNWHRVFALTDPNVNPADLDDGTPICLPGPSGSGMIVTRSFGDQCFYVEQDDRSWGIKVVPRQPLSVSDGDRVTIYGILEADPGTERYIDATSVQVVSQGNPIPEALGMRNNWLGGEDIGSASGISLPEEPCTLYNLGLLVTSWGHVTSVNTTDSYFYIDDGSDLEGADGDGVRVECYGFQPSESIDEKYVQVVGISGMEGGYRVLRVNDSQDIDELTADTAAGELYAGWNLISLPEVPVNPDPPSVFESIDGWEEDAHIYRWDACTRSLIVYDRWMPDAFGNMLYGEGYWLAAIPPDPTLEYEAVDVSGYDQWISAPNPGVWETGWKYWGNPYDTGPLGPHVAWEDILVTNGRETITMREASQYNRGWLNSLAYWWDAEYQGLYTVGLPEDWPEDTHLRPWHGYEMLVYSQGLALIIPKPQP